MIAYPLADISLTEGLDQPSDGVHLSLADVRPLIDIQCNVGDDEVNQYVRRVQTFKAEHIIKRINVGITEIRKRWPTASGPELYTAFDMCQESIEDLIESIEKIQK